MKIDIVSDVVCPWCIIGYKQLEHALAETGINADIQWHPFELNPHMVEEGENLREHLAAKYGTTLDDSIRARARLTAMGAELGFAFNYADDMRMHNTFRAHQLIHWANQRGKAHALKLALFEAFFSDRENVNDVEVLARVAGNVGLDPIEAREVLAERRYADAVRAAEKHWIVRGVGGVPAMIFNEKHLVTGAQGVENYINVLRQLNDDEAA